MNIGIVGGGLAGIAAAAEAIGRGWQVELFEARPTLGGRVGSFFDRQVDRLVDHCTHLALGCCDSFLDFLRQTETIDLFRRDRRIPILYEGGKRRDVFSLPLLPAPLHLFGSLLRNDSLSIGERFHLVRAMRKLVALQPNEIDESLSLGDWLKTTGQSEQAVKRFWSVVLESALSASVDQVDVRYARKVFADAFFSRRDGFHPLIPTEPLASIVDQRIGDWLAAQGVTIHRRRGVQRIDVPRPSESAGQEGTIRTADGETCHFNAIVSAVPWFRVESLLAPDIFSTLIADQDFRQLEPAAIGAVHLWLDRPVTALPAGAISERTSQWFYASSHGDGQYLQLVISDAGRLLGTPADRLTALVIDELRTIFPAIESVRVVHSCRTIFPRAVFMPSPGVDRIRPLQRTGIDGFALAGDWMSTGWPATMESAVRSGRAAIEALTDR